MEIFQHQLNIFDSNQSKIMVLDGTIKKIE